MTEWFRRNWRKFLLNFVKPYLLFFLGTRANCNSPALAIATHIECPSKKHTSKPELNRTKHRAPNWSSLSPSSCLSFASVPSKVQECWLMPMPLLYPTSIAPLNLYVPAICRLFHSPALLIYICSRTWYEALGFCHFPSRQSPETSLQRMRVSQRNAFSSSML